METDLKNILLDHSKWLQGDGGSRANLTGANLTRANLTGANLTRANLTGANLTRANLTGANLTEANLARANLTGANLARANLTEANLAGANLTGANLAGANLTEANLAGADLTKANLTMAHLFYTKMCFKLSEPEAVARKRLKTMIDPDEYIRYENFGYCIVEGAIFGMMELVGTSTGWWCVTVNSPEVLPHADRLMHRIYLWRKGPEHFYNVANKQI